MWCREAVTGTGAVTAGELVALIRARFDLVLEQVDRVDVGLQTRIERLDGPDAEPDVVVVDVCTRRFRVIHRVLLMPTASAASPVAEVDARVLQVLDQLDELAHRFGRTLPLGGR